MSAESRRQLLGIFRHYGHGLRAQLRGGGTVVGLLLGVAFALHLGWRATDWMRMVEIAGLAELRLPMATTIVGLTFQTTLVLAATFLVTAAGILFSPNQRREMLCLSAWPIAPRGLALMKLLDGHFLVMLAVLLLVPGALRALPAVRSLDEFLFVAAGIAYYLGHVLGVYFLVFTYVALGAAWYARVLRKRLSLTTFVPLWLGGGLLPVGLLLFPEWTGWWAGAGYGRLWALAWLAGRDGALAVTLFWMLAVYALFRLAWFAVGWGYVSVIDRFASVTARLSADVAHDLGSARHAWRWLPPAVRAIVRKDLRILSRHPLILITVLTSLVLSLTFLKPLLAGNAGHAAWIGLAATGPILLQVAYHELMTMEGPGGEHLVAFPASARAIVAGKTLGALLLNLPLPVLALVLVVPNGLSASQVAFFFLWVTWLPGVVVTQLAIAGVFARRKATRMSETRAPLSVFVGLPLQIPFAMWLTVLVILAEAEPFLAVVGMGLNLLVAFAILRFSTGILHLMER